MTAWILPLLSRQIYYPTEILTFPASLSRGPEDPINKPLPLGANVLGGSAAVVAGRPKRSLHPPLYSRHSLTHRPPRPRTQGHLALRLQDIDKRALRWTPRMMSRSREPAEPTTSAMPPTRASTALCARPRHPHPPCERASPPHQPHEGRRAEQHPAHRPLIHHFRRAHSRRADRSTKWRSGVRT